MTDFSRCDVCQARVRSFKAWNPSDPQAWLLPCLHVTCAACRSKCQGANHPQKIVCPLCKTESSKNLLLLIPDSRSCLIRCETPACPEKKIATMKCLTCNELLCAECGVAHRRVTATSNHILHTVDQILPEHCRCPIHNNVRALCVCTCGLASCSDCLRLGIHNGPQHAVTPIVQLAASSRIDDEKIKSSTAREISHIESSLSMVGLRKQMLVDRIDTLKKEVGNSVVKACNTLVRRGWDLMNTLDHVKKERGDEYEKLSEELRWQQLRFNRINSYIDQVKEYQEPTSLVLTKAYLTNCINVIKAKKVYNERSLNSLQRPPQVELKSNFDQLTNMAAQCGRVFADSSDGTLKAVDIHQHPATTGNVLNVPLFDVNKNNVRMPVINSVPSTSAHPLPLRPTLSGPESIRPNAPAMRGPMTPEQIRMFQQQQQQQFRSAQEVAMRQVAQAARRPIPADQRLPVLAGQLSSPTISAIPHRFPLSPPSAYPHPMGPVQAIGPNKYVLPTGQIVEGPLRPTTAITGPIPAAALMEQFGHFANIPCEPNTTEFAKQPTSLGSPLMQQVSGPRMFAKQAERERAESAAHLNESVNHRSLDSAIDQMRKESAHRVVGALASPTSSRALAFPQVPTSTTREPTQWAAPSRSFSVDESHSSACGKSPSVRPTNEEASSSSALATEKRTSQDSGSECAQDGLATIPSRADHASAASEVTSRDERQNPQISSTSETNKANASVYAPSFTFEQERMSPPETPSTSEPHSAENSITTSGRSNEVSTEIHDLFANRTNHLSLEMDGQSNTSTVSPPPKDPEPGATKTPLKVTIRRELLSIVSPGYRKNDSRPSQDGSNENVDDMRWEDYCYVCQQGCDDKTGSLGCCAKCPRVYHNFCHVPAIKEQMEKLPDEWQCSLCTSAEPLVVDTGIMSARERLLCSKVLLRCYEDHQNVEPFTHPVPKNVVNYYVVIKKPIDFACIARRLKEKAREPFVNVSQFMHSMNMVFENCSTFNPPDTEVAQAGREVYQLYVKAVNDYLPCMKNLVWLYITKYSEAKIAALVQKEMQGIQISRFVRAHSTETDGGDPCLKKPRREIKEEF